MSGATGRGRDGTGAWPMVAPEAARELARRALARSHRGWTLGEVPTPAWSLPLKPPTEQVVLADPQAAQSWVRGWRAATLPAGIRVEWAERSWRSVGRQQVPVRVNAVTPDALVAWVGGREAREQRVFAERVAAMRRLAEAWGGSGPSAAGGAGSAPQTQDDDGEAAADPRELTLAAALRRHAQRLTDLSEPDFLRVVAVLEWLRTTPVQGLRPRQLPIRGVDSKWFGAHRTLLEALHAPQEGGLGIVDAHPTVRVRILDPALRPEGLRDLEVPLEQAAAWPIAPARVLVVENSETLLCLPDAPGAVAVWGRGFDTAATVLPWLRGAELHYWGDLDSHGFAILHRYRTRLPQLRSVLMDVRTLEAFRDLCVPDPTPFRGALATLTSDEARALERLRAEGDVRLEQERVGWDHALSALDAHFVFCDAGDRAAGGEDADGRRIAS